MEEHGKALSKNLLYAPLTAYHKAAASTTCVDDKGGIDCQFNNYHKKKIVKESSLVSFLHSVSCDYHRNRRSAVNDAKNNGSRPLGLADIEDRIRQRAVTLIGGGINSSIIPITIQRKLNKKRHRKSSEEMEPILKKKKLLSSLPLSSSSSSLTEITTTLDGRKYEGSGNTNNDEIISFLQGLNIAWNAYVWKVIALNKIHPSSTHKQQNLLHDGNKNDKVLQYFPPLKEIEYKLIALTRINKNSNNNNRSSSNNYRPLELIGSHVRIESCNSHRSWIGRFGILIGETTNTYRIAGYITNNKGRRNKKKKRDQTKEFLTSTYTSICASDCVNNESDISMSDVKEFLLPKCGSSLVLIVPIPDLIDSTDSKSSCVNNMIDNDDRDSLYWKKDDTATFLDTKSIIHLPDKAICISILDPDKIK